VPNQPKNQLFPASETEYFARETTIRLIFKINSEGKVNSVDLNNSGTVTTANRISQ
jgi:hypothetical protein